MRIPLHEINETPSHLEFTGQTDWVQSVVKMLHESGLDPSKQPTTPVFVEFELSQVDSIYMVGGQAETDIDLLCSRCAKPFSQNCSPHFRALFSKDKSMLHHVKSRSRSKEEVQQSRDNASSEDIEITQLDTDFIDLAEILAEQLQLQIPFQPLCSESCRGLCQSCGTDLNTSSCQCATERRVSPFESLRTFALTKEKAQLVEEKMKVN